jgi:hypothetical protein
MEYFNFAANGSLLILLFLLTLLFLLPPGLRRNSGT